MTRNFAHNPALDNAKFILIFLVIIGHVIEPFIRHDPIIKALYMTIYSFHMPAFVMISGMLSRNHTTNRFIPDLIKKLIVPLLIFTVIYEAAHFILFGEVSIYISEFKPYWILWYLYSLFIWRATAPITNKIPGVIILSVILSLGICLIDNFKNNFGLMRTLYFWPFFLLGLRLGPNIINHTLLRKVSPIFCWVCIMGMIYYFFILSGFQYSLFYGTKSYFTHGLSDLNGIITKLAIYMVSLMMCICCFRLVPHNLNIPTHLKTNTLYAYVWHGLAIKAALALGLIEFCMQLSRPILYIFLAISALALTLLFSSNIVKSLTNKFLLGPLQNPFK